MVMHGNVMVIQGHVMVMQGHVMVMQGHVIIMQGLETSHGLSLRSRVISLHPKTGNSIRLKSLCYRPVS